MLQRIQSVLLAVVVALGVVFSFIAVLGYSGYESYFEMGAYKTINIETGELLLKNMGVGVLQGIVILISALVIFLYKNRGLQMKLLKLNILFIALQIVALVFYSDAVKSAINSDTADISVSYKFGAIIPILCLILTYLAIRYIKKDDDLVRSADRLR